ncbi:unnamed protein product [marine sediment metagenome]|uniref:Uncharacterized protein n=1 Tax=marine sediment metagenome TaxID=412755 RepID=X1BVN3_9ZZZZ
MPQVQKRLIKDIGLQREVEEALPYAVVGGAWEGSFEEQPMYGDQEYTPLNYVVPAGHQLKILFIRIWGQGPVRFSIVQTNPAEQDLVGAAAAYPVVGSVPPGSPPTATAAVTAVRDYPMMEAAGAEILHGSLVDPIHVLEGSIDFNVLSPWPGAPEPGDPGFEEIAHTGLRYGIAWWGVIKIPEPTR